MENKLTTRANRLDECVSELSPLAQDFFKQAVELLSDQLANSGGAMSAKEILYQLAFTGLYKPEPKTGA